MQSVHNLNESFMHPQNIVILMQTLRTPYSNVMQWEGPPITFMQGVAWTVTDCSIRVFIENADVGHVIYFLSPNDKGGK